MFVSFIQLEESVRSPWVQITRLADTTGIDIPTIKIETDAFTAEYLLDDPFSFRIKPENRRDMCMSIHATSGVEVFQVQLRR